MDVVFENGGLVDGGEVPGTGQRQFGLDRQSRQGRTRPLVKTFNNDVFPHAPSPLFARVSRDCRRRLCPARAYSKTSLRWTVFDPPQSDGILVGSSGGGIRDGLAAEGAVVGSGFGRRLEFWRWAREEHATDVARRERQGKAPTGSKPPRRRRGRQRRPGPRGDGRGRCRRNRRWPWEEAGSTDGMRVWNSTRATLAQLGREMVKSEEMGSAPGVVDRGGLG